MKVVFSFNSHSSASSRAGNSLSVQFDTGLFDTFAVCYRRKGHCAGHMCYWLSNRALYCDQICGSNSEIDPKAVADGRMSFYLTMLVDSEGRL